MYALYKMSSVLPNEPWALTVQKPRDQSDYNDKHGDCKTLNRLSVKENAQTELAMHSHGIGTEVCKA
jgi:hypothetical protein